jgi:peroxiredoxin
MGQARQVAVFLLVTEDTLEENLLATLSAKRELALAALDAESDVTQVDVRTGAEDLKQRLEILLGAKPDAAVDRVALERGGAISPNIADAGKMLVRATDLDGRDVALSSLYGKGPILLAFYRGGWCPYCSTENHSLSVAYPDFQKRGVTPVTISVDKPEAEAKTKATYSIPFPVLSDPDATVLEAFHVVNNVDKATYAKMKGFGVDLESYSGEGHHKIAIPSLFLIDKAGTVRWAHSDPDYKVRPSIAQILTAIDAAGLL